MDEVAAGPMRARLEQTQALVPAGEALIAWVNTPFHLDFARNPIVDVEPAGAGNPWAYLPPARYLLLDYGGFATRPPNRYRSLATRPGARERLIAARALELSAMLATAFGGATALYDDGRIRLLRVGEASRP
jgi:hypothetical protein